MKVQLDKMRLKLGQEKNLFLNLSSLEEKIKFLLRYAILAPSTHNTQPWFFRVKDNTCQILFNPELKLKYADPKCRDLYISLGCAMENLIIAGHFYGLTEKIEYEANDNDDNLVATVYFFEKDNHLDFSSEKLLDTILKRVNVRGKFLDRPVASDLLAGLQNLFEKDYGDNQIKMNFIQDKEKIEKLALLTQKGMRMAHSNKLFRREMSDWIVHNYPRRRDGMIGYSMNMPGPISFFISPLIRLFNLGSIMGKVNYLNVSSAPAVCVVTAPEYRAETWIKIGRLVERAMLEFNQEGLTTSIYLASVEMGDLYKEIQEILSTTEIPQFIFVVGHIDSQYRTTPRHNLESKLIK